MVALRFIDRRCAGQGGQWNYTSTEITPGQRIKFACVPCSIRSCRMLGDGWLLGYIKVVFAIICDPPSVTQ
jgi:hypothetical protein